MTNEYKQIMRERIKEIEQLKKENEKLKKKVAELQKIINFYKPNYK